MLNSVNYYSSMSSNKGMGGLLSGLDTDSLVEQLTSGTRSRIASTLQKKQLELWRQESYREVSKQLVDFKGKYFSTLSGDKNILSPSFFESSGIKNDSPYVNVSGSTSSIKDFVIKDIKELAGTAKFTSSQNLSKQSLTTGKLRENWVDTAISGSSVFVKYEGKDYNIKIDDNFKFSEAATTDELKLQEVVAQLNKQIANVPELKGADGSVKIEFSIDAGKVKLSNTAGNTGEIEISGGTNKLIEGLKLPLAEKSTTGLVGTDVAVCTGFYKNMDLKSALLNQSITFNLDGIERQIKFDEKRAGEFDTVAKLQTYLDTELKKSFGNKVNVTLSADNQLTFKTNSDGSVLKVSGASGNAILGEDGALRVNQGASNRLGWGTQIKDILGDFNVAPTTNNGKYEMVINDITFSFDETDTLSSVMSKINNSQAGVRVSYSATTDKLSITAKDSGLNGRVEIKDSGTSNFATTLFGADKTPQVAGSDAVVEVSFDGGKTTTTITRSSNTFTIDNINIELKGKAPDVNGAPVAENITFGVETNIDEVVKKIVGFIDDYNKIIKSSHEKTLEKRDRNYQPLTAEQKKDMSEDEVKQWEEKAKKGILQSDKYLNGLMSDLRVAMNASVEGVDSALYKIGISTTAYNFAETGQLKIDETQLRKALTDDKEQVIALFTHISETGATDTEKNRNSGVAQKLDSVLNKYASTTGEDGLLISLAGYKGDNTENNNTINNRLNQFDRTLATLKDRLATEESRHWRKFTALETALSNMNSQSQWLSQQFSQ